MNKHGCGEWEHFALYGHEEILIKIYEIPCQNLKWSHKIVPCVTLLKNCSRNCEQWKNMGGGGGRDFLHCVDFREILQNSSPLKPLAKLRNNFTEMFLG